MSNDSKKVRNWAFAAYLIDLSVGFIGNVENPRHIAKYNLNHLNRISKELDVCFKDFFPEKAI